ncbi:GDSL-type esterase/lipase family protein [Mariniflexile ostreae]|uniref:GDSL-type esterase/lipase family protein n=1 Tax=Mariniflexile ostreae TaxID=1520892 RepID=A0ABV5FAG3_9FLAO
MTSKKIIGIVLLLVSTIFNSGAQNSMPDSKMVYKVIEGDSLYLHVFKPHKAKKPTAVMVFFFGGGWTGGDPKQFYQQSAYFASRGILAISVEYRVKSIHGTSPFESVEDAKSAIRWVRENAKKLNIDSNKIIASGGSAGGHLAITTALIDGFENLNENVLVSSLPNAVIAYNPVLDTTEKGYGFEKVMGRETEISPTHHIKKGTPPMLIFHGTDDDTVPFENAERFTKLMKEAGNACELVAVDYVGHGFFNGDFFRKYSGNKYFNLTMYQTDVFLKKLGCLKGKPTLPENITHLSCIGDSNTEAKYPTFLQEKLGETYQVKNFGKGGATLIDGTNNPYFKTDPYKNSLKFTPDVVLIMFGTNDANVKWTLDTHRKTAFVGTPQEEFKSQYVKLIQTYKRNNEKAQIYVLTPLPIYEHEKSKDPQINQRIENLNEWVIPIIKELAIEEQVTVIDVNKLMKKAYKYTADGVHLNEKGYQVLAKKIAKKIK